MVRYKGDWEIVGKFVNFSEDPYFRDALRYRFFREKRFKEKRIYYLIYDDLSAVLVVAVEGKKTQQETIDYIVSYLSEYKKYMNKLFN